MPEIEVVAYRSSWPSEFAATAGRLRAALGEAALRIDHIGSTSVPALAAKDVIDLQVIVRDLSPLHEQFARAGFEPRFGGRVVADHVPVTWDGEAHAWCKRLYGPVSGRRVNAHVRVRGSPNERYALLFRDYLRVHHDARDRWGMVKARIAAVVADIDEYLDLKDPLTDELMADAERWAAESGWSGPAA